ncbi:MAG: VOC family protein [Pseudomonadota bacterium]|nr:VOC family protein [Pseudomonadota bacterium]
MTDIDLAVYGLLRLEAALVAAFLFLTAAQTHIEFDRGFVFYGADERQLQSKDLIMLASSKLQTIIWTSRIDEAEQFYSGVLGLPFKGKSVGALVYEVGGGDLRVSPVPSTLPSVHTVLGFGVSNLSSVVTALNARGINFERFPGFPHDAAGVLVTPDGARVAWFRDPDGNLLSIVQYA